MLVSLLKYCNYKRLFVQLRRGYPAFFFLLSLLSGQYCGTYFELDWQLRIILYLLIVGLFALRYLTLAIFLFGLLSTAWTVSAFPTTIQSVAGLEVRLLNNPLLKKTQSVILELKILSAPQGYEALQSQKIICQALSLPWLNIDKIKVGDTFNISAQVYPLKQSSDFDYRLYLQGFNAHCKILFISKAINNSQSFLDETRLAIINHIFDLPGDSESKALFLAMTFGFDSGVSERLAEAFKRTGLAHLMVVSGYQLMAIFILMFELIKRFLPTRKYPWLSYLLSQFIPLLLVLLFTSIVGSENSCLRALIALGLLIVDRIFERNTSFLNIIISSALILNLIYPGAFLDVGVQLTFAALIGIWIGNRHEQALINYVAVTFWAGITTTLVIWNFFQTLYPLSFFYNLVFAPLLSFLVTQLGIISVSMMNLFPVISSYTTEFILWICSEWIQLLFVLSENYTFLGGGCWGLVFLLILLLRLFVIFRDYLIVNALLIIPD